ncbi:N-acetyltransferase, partial [Lactobacillus sp. XV13L]|nr:N-acetyltransferase [Lactobacillus sp. XV13L]
MKYVEKITLSKKETDQAERLAQLVHEKDGTYSDIYLNNQYNYFADMPTFVLAYHEDELVGLTMLYADDAPNEGVDIHLEVAPSMRRRKIAQAMLARAYKILSRYGYEQFYYVCEQGFLDLNPQFLANVKLEVDDAEYNMCCTAPAPIAHDDELDQALTVRTLSPADVDEVAAMHSQAFGENPASSRKYIAQGLEDKDACSFVLVCQDKIAGYCAVDVGTY